MVEEITKVNRKLSTDFQAQYNIAGHQFKFHVTTFPRPIRYHISCASNPLFQYESIYQNAMSRFAKYSDATSHNLVIYFMKYIPKQGNGNTDKNKSK